MIGGGRFPGPVLSPGASPACCPPMNSRNFAGGALTQLSPAPWKRARCDQPQPEAQPFPLAVWPCGPPPNPCPAAWFGDPQRPRALRRSLRQRYWSMLSLGPARSIDLQVVMRRLKQNDTAGSRQPKVQPAPTTAPSASQEPAHGGGAPGPRGPASMVEAATTAAAANSALSSATCNSTADLHRVT